jgi:serine/threonine protein kinase
MLKKKSPKTFFRAVWQPRYFVLYDDVLQYFKKKDDVNPCGTIPLNAISTIKRWEGKKNGCRFDIELAKRTFCLQTDTDNECDLWTRKIEESMQKLEKAGQLKLTYDDRGKFWKNTTEIRQARARSSVNWGDRRYLLAAPDATEDGKSSTDNSITDTDEKDDVQIEAQFHITKKVADGPFGQIYRVVGSDKRSCLMHAFLSDDPYTQTARSLLFNMRKLQHPYIFEQLHLGETSDAIFAVYSYAPDASLFAHIRNSRRLPADVARFFAAEVLLACEYLHSQDRTFRNLGPEMIFVDEEGHAIISDFLLCLPEEDMPDDASTPEYTTPEMLEHAQECPASDWWRLGVLLYEMLVGFPPIRSKTNDPNELSQKIKAHTAETLRFPPFVSAECVDLVRTLLNPDPLQRFENAAAIKAHPWFSQSIDFDALSRRAVQSPAWIDLNLQASRRATASQSRTLDPLRSYRLMVRVREGRGLPAVSSTGDSSNASCEIICGSNSATTATVQKTVAPVWDEFHEFPVSNRSGVIKVNVNHKEAGDSNTTFIGCVEIPIEDIFTQRHISDWCGIIGADYMAHGELLLELMWFLETRGTRIDQPSMYSVSCVLCLVSCVCVCVCVCVVVFCCFLCPLVHIY